MISSDAIIFVYLSSSSYSRSSSSRSSSYSVTSSSSGSVRRERRKHKAESRKAAAEAALLNNLAGGKNSELAAENLAPNPSEKEDGVNFGLSGKLLEDTNTVNGVVVKYSEPQEARKPR